MGRHQQPLNPILIFCFLIWGLAMNELLKLQKQLSELREEFAKDSTTDERRKEIRGKMVDLEPKLRAELDKQETRESTPVVGLSDRVELRNYLDAAVNNRQVSGAEAELNQERGLNLDGYIPWDALLETVEERADAATDVAAAAIGDNQQSILARVFNQTSTQFLGIRMPSAAVGDALYPVLTAGVAGSPANEAVAVDSEAATFTGVSISPKRLSAAYLVSVEDMARLRGMEPALRSDLRQALGSLLDTQVLTGDGSGANFSGVLKGLTDPDAATNAITYAAWAAEVAAGVDGKYANQLNQVKHVVGVKTFQKLASTFQANTSASALIFSHQFSGGVRASAAIAAPADNVQSGIRTVRGSDAVVPVWQGIQLIRDPYTSASRGLVRLTAFMLANFKFLRQDAWAEISVKLA